MAEWLRYSHLPRPTPTVVGRLRAGAVFRSPQNATLSPFFRLDAISAGPQTLTMNRVTPVVDPEPCRRRANVRGGPLDRPRGVAIGFTIVVSLAIACGAQAQIGDLVNAPENRIVPHVGLGKLKLGMSQEEVLAILGRASRVVPRPNDSSEALYVSKASAAVLVVDYEHGKAVEFEFTSPR